jgi:uncharacterized protein (TIGR00251 family)
VSDKGGWRVSDRGVEIDVLVSPKSGRSTVESFDRWRSRLVVKLRSPPEKGEANRELLDLLARELGARVEVVRGQTSRSKTVLAVGDTTAIERRLEDWREGP